MVNEKQMYAIRILLGLLLMVMVLIGLTIATVILENKDVVNNTESKTIIVGKDTVKVNRFLQVLVD